MSTLRELIEEWLGVEAEFTELADEIGTMQMAAAGLMTRRDKIGDQIVDDIRAEPRKTREVSS